MRLQLALNVRNLDEAIDFYGKFFNARPHKIRKGYANFAIDSPPLKLVLFENPNADERLNHLGVEVFEQAAVEDAQRRFGESGILDAVETETVCCHAAQNKIWAREPQGLKWEWYRITDDNPVQKANQSTCCAGAESGALGRIEEGKTATCCA
jgi:catechol 2,3-dioxygenase-like lactoylglutathione lyase family enzyme